MSKVSLIFFFYITKLAYNSQSNQVGSTGIWQEHLEKGRSLPKYILKNL